MKQTDHPKPDLNAELSTLRKKLATYRELKRKYQKTLSELGEKEAFNFALFQFSPATTVVVDRNGRVVKSNAAKRKSSARLPNIGDIMYKDYASHHKIDMHKELLRCIETGQMKSFSEMHYGDKIMSITLAPFPQGAIITSEDITDRVRMEQNNVKLIQELRRALNEVETLRSLLPICASCKKIRDDKGYWNTVEEYFGKRNSVDFSHTVCPECIKDLYPDLWEKMPSIVAKTNVKKTPVN